MALVALLALLFTTAAADQQALSKIDKQRGVAMLRQMRENIEKYYYDPTYRGIDLAGKFKAAEEQIEKAASLNEVYAILTDTVRSLDDSHTYFIPPGRNATVAYGWSMAPIGDDAYVVGVTPGSDAAAKGIERGDQVIALNRFQPSRQNLWDINYLYRVVRPQQLQRVTLRKPDGSVKTVDVASKITPIRNLQLVDLLNVFDEETTAAAHEIIQMKNVCVWRMPEFGDPDLADASARKARDAKAIVLDLRGNGGGLADTLVTMAGWFFDREITIATMKERKKTRTVTAQPKRDVLRAALVVLVDGGSGSAAEMFARVVQLEKRGTVVGDRTAGAVMTGRFESHSLGLDTMTFYGTSVTVADVRMSDGGSLEKAGVKPDELVLPTGADLAAKRDPALARAIALAGATITPEAAGKLYRDITAK